MEINFLLNKSVRRYWQLSLLITLLLASSPGEAASASADLKLMSSVTAPIPIRGKVTDNAGQPLIGATVKVKGTNIGASTNVDGNFSIEAEGNSTLVISYTGFETVEVAVNNRQSINVQMKSTTTALGEVVITALGIKRERKALGYSVTEVKGEELTQAREINVANSLVGKVAGVNVNTVSGGPGASSNVIIRGVSSLSGNNQPLYVVNGIPFVNEPQGNSGGQFTGSPDLGDGISNINPDDIASISVLKGAAASALYGYRAKYGVILITTKSGAGRGMVEFNSNYVMEQVMNPTDWQYVYGMGTNGTKPLTQATAFDVGGSSWGARLDGTDVVQYDGVSRPYVAQQNNIENFYQNGGTFTNTIAFNRGFEDGSFRFSASNLSNTSIIPNSGLQRQNFNVSGNFNVSKRLTVDARANLIRDKADNRPVLGDLAGNVNYNIMFLPTSLDVRTLKPGTKADGLTEMQFTNSVYATNPWYSADFFIHNTLRNRLVGSASARYTFDNGIFAQIRAGQDSYNDRYSNIVPSGAAYYPVANQHISEQFNKTSEFNTDILLGGLLLKPTEGLTITPSIGANLTKARSENTTENGLNYAVPYVYTIMNAKNQSITYSKPRSDVQSVYGTLDLEYKNFLYLSASARNDWFSALWPSKKVDIFYPSVSGSFVFSELFSRDWLSFGKLRAGWANVGGGLGPYQTLLSYGLLNGQLNGLPLGTITNGSIPNNDLKPSNARELEIGTELRFFENRLSFDVSWYNKRSSNEILSAPASTTSGYSGVVLNVGELENIGVEALVTGIPVKGVFTWSTSVNGSINNNKVLALSAGQGSLGVAISRTGTGFTQQIVGKPANQVMAFDYKYDANGAIMNAATGVPSQGLLTPWGSAYHKWTGGWNNDFSYKGVTLSFLIDGKFGGKVFSATDAIGYGNGLHKGTLDREKAFGTINAQTYYSTLATNVSKMFVYDASFIKFRQFMLGYSVPSSLLGTRVQGATISVVGRNLFTLMKKTDNIDPEASYGGISQGLELGGVPPVRTFGLNLGVKF